MYIKKIKIKPTYILMILLFVFTSNVFAHGGLNLSWSSPSDVGYMLLIIAISGGPIFFISAGIIWMVLKHHNKENLVKYLFRFVTLFSVLYFLATFFFVILAEKRY